jgi:hypothetical protein
MTKSTSKTTAKQSNGTFMSGSQNELTLFRNPYHATIALRLLAKGLVLMQGTTCKKEMGNG